MEQVQQQFSVFVKNEQPPFEELKRRFPAYVSFEYRNNEWFKPIEYYKDRSMDNCEVTLEVVHLDRDVSTDEVLAEMKCLGLRPARYEALLSFAEKYPDEQKKYPIIALGSVIGTGSLRNVACLWDEGRGRLLTTRQFSNKWDNIYRFLAFRK